jgi:UDP-N-acetyl-D-mannosaminuronic acid dehydrogenase
LYQIFVNGKIILTDATTAEMVKLMENTYRDVNIAIANEFSRLADRFGVNVWEAISIANLHPRVNILQPGIGVGGHCISVDPWFLVEAAPELANLICTARKVNDSQPDFILNLVERVSGKNLSGKRITILGLAYKAGVDDMRESPAIQITSRLVEKGAQVTAFDPYKPSFAVNGIKSAANLPEALKDAEMIVLLVGHPSLVDLDPEELISLTDARLVIDAVNKWTGKKWEDTPLHIYHFGTHDFPKPV